MEDSASSESTIQIGPYEVVARLETAEDDLLQDDLIDPLGALAGDPGDSPKIEIAVFNGRERVATHALIRNVTLLGCGSKCHLRFEPDSVSRVHCCRVRSPSGVTVYDLVGKEGTLVNGQRIRSRRLKYRDLVKIGDFQLRIHFVEELDRTAKTDRLEDVSGETPPSKDQPQKSEPDCQSHTTDSAVADAGGEQERQEESVLGSAVPSILPEEPEPQAELLTSEQLRENVIEFNATRDQTLADLKRQERQLADERSEFEKHRDSLAVEQQQLHDERAQHEQAREEFVETLDRREKEFHSSDEAQRRTASNLRRQSKDAHCLQAQLQSRVQENDNARVQNDRQRSQVEADAKGNSQQQEQLQAATAKLDGARQTLLAEQDRQAVHTQQQRDAAEQLRQSLVARSCALESRELVLRQQQERLQRSQDGAEAAQQRHGEFEEQLQESKAELTREQQALIDEKDRQAAEIQDQRHSAEQLRQSLVARSGTLDARELVLRQQQERLQHSKDGVQADEQRRCELQEQLQEQLRQSRSEMTHEQQALCDEKTRLAAEAKEQHHTAEQLRQDVVARSDAMDSREVALQHQHQELQHAQGEAKTTADDNSQLQQALEETKSELDGARESHRVERDRWTIGVDEERRAAEDLRQSLLARTTALDARESALGQQDEKLRASQAAIEADTETIALQTANIRTQQVQLEKCGKESTLLLEELAHDESDLRNSQEEIEQQRALLAEERSRFADERKQLETQRKAVQAANDTDTLARNELRSQEEDATNRLETERQTLECRAEELAENRRQFVAESAELEAGLEVLSREQGELAQHREAHKQSQLQHKESEHACQQQRAELERKAKALAELEKRNVEILAAKSKEHEAHVESQSQEFENSQDQATKQLQTQETELVRQRDALNEDLAKLSREQHVANRLREEQETLTADVERRRSELEAEMQRTKQESRSERDRLEQREQSLEEQTLSLDQRQSQLTESESQVAVRQRQLESKSQQLDEQATRLEARSLKMARQAQEVNETLTPSSDAPASKRGEFHLDSKRGTARVVQLARSDVDPETDARPDRSPADPSGVRRRPPAPTDSIPLNTNGTHAEDAPAARSDVTAAGENTVGRSSADLVELPQSAVFEQKLERLRHVKLEENHTVWSGRMIALIAASVVGLVAIASVVVFAIGW